MRANIEDNYADKSRSCTVSRHDCIVAHVSHQLYCSSSSSGGGVFDEDLPLPTFLRFIRVDISCTPTTAGLTYMHTKTLGCLL